MWTNLWHYCFAHGWIRYPLCLVPPLVYDQVLGDYIETTFKRLNAGHNQIDVWQRVAAKVKDLEKEDE